VISPSKANGKMQLAIDRLASDYPLHAGILSQWRIDEDTAIDTMGVGFRDGKLRLIYNPDFVESISMDELQGVLHHESNHVLFDHVYHVPEPGENRTARTIAEEVTVNEWVPEPLPAGAVTLRDHPDLPANESTDDRYGRLRHRVRESKDAARGAAPRPGTGSGTASGQATGQSAAAEGSGTNGVPTVDNHGTWAEITGNAAPAKAAAQMDTAMAWGGLTGEQRADVGEPFASIAKKTCEQAGMDSGTGEGMGIGSAAGAGESEIEGGEAHVPWQVVLRRYVGQITERRPVFGRPPRRFPDMVGIIPGRARFAGRPKVMAVIDTSGSMSEPMLADISAELGLMAQHYEVTVVECDAAIHAVYPYRPIKNVHGRGGTSFQPPFEPEFLRKHNPDMVVYFTDGGGVAPDTKPRLPVVWCLTEDGTRPAPWGQEVHLQEPKISPLGPDFGT
jgi:hypothetical protein